MLWRLFLFVRNYVEELHIRKHVNKRNLSHNGKFDRKKWMLVKDVVGVRERDPIICFYCNSQMVLRKSILQRSSELNYSNTVIDLMYKCPVCSLCLTFGIAIPESHYYLIKKMRKENKIGEAYAPLVDWEGYEIIRKRLQQLGYW